MNSVLIRVNTSSNSQGPQTPITRIVRIRKISIRRPRVKPKARVLQIQVRSPLGFLILSLLTPPPPRSRPLSLPLSLDTIIELLVYVRSCICVTQLGFAEEMADGYWNQQQHLNPSAGMLKRPRSDYGKLHSLISFEYILVCVR